MAPPIITEPPDRARLAAFPVSLIFYIEDPELRALINVDDRQFGGDAPVLGHDEVFRFSIEAPVNEDELTLSLRRISLREMQCAFVVISDRLTERGDKGKLRPGRLATSIRQQFLVGRHLCGLVAIEADATRRVSDIDRIVLRSADRESLRTAIVLTATGLRLKARPPARASKGLADGVKIQAVQSASELRQCLALRKQVYGLMGYLPERIMDDPSGIELDTFDERSIHFAAKRGNDVIGTVRLVLELPAKTSPGMGASGLSQRGLMTLQDHDTWCRKIAQTAGPAIRRRLAAPSFMPLPILESSEFDSRWSRVLRATSPGAELSRLVVKLEYRGLHISVDLIRAVLAKSVEMQRRVLLLECIPVHEGMYSRYGFRRMDGDPHTRPTDLDQYAVAMWFRLDEQQSLVESAEKLLAKLKMGLLPRFGPIDTPLLGD